MSKLSLMISECNFYIRVNYNLLETDPFCLFPSCLFCSIVLLLFFWKLNFNYMYCEYDKFLQVLFFFRTNSSTFRKVIEFWALLKLKRARDTFNVDWTEACHFKSKVWLHLGIYVKAYYFVICCRLMISTFWAQSDLQPI